MKLTDSQKINAWDELLGFIHDLKKERDNPHFEGNIHTVDEISDLINKIERSVTER